MRSTRARGTTKPTSKGRTPAIKAAAKRPRNVARAVVRTADTIAVTSTMAQNTFGDIVDRAARDAVVVITRHAKPRVVLLSYERYLELMGTEATMLPALADAFDAQFARLQNPDVWARTVKGFRASPRAMGRAAQAAARAGAAAGMVVVPSGHVEVPGVRGARLPRVATKQAALASRA